MRFTADGPSIDDELLYARDRGEVIFFCGAGVSIAKAGLPNFFDLANKVILKLGAQKDSAAYKLMKEAQSLYEQKGLTGLISTDRIFSLLEREFLVTDIRKAVAQALRPQSKKIDLSAHQILLDLATTSEGKVQLVTTNFDRLFEKCKPSLKIWQAPRLPRPSLTGELDGIVYLHGRVKGNYTGADERGFILSSAEFGRAYLSEGWATSFFREILQYYKVVFIGYGAEDPPVQYLLEALHKRPNNLKNIYAFQAGMHEHDAIHWKQKGVRTVLYKPSKHHHHLWQTLELWAERARSIDDWVSKVLLQTAQHPCTLEPYQRGQISHIISTAGGMEKFANYQPIPLAEWLYVLDSSRRYALPTTLNRGTNNQLCIDPFDLYCLDEDIPPEKIKPEEYLPQREIEVSAWDAFKINQWDRQNLTNEHLSSIQGVFSVKAAPLVPRLDFLGCWIAKVAVQPAALCWAAQQSSIHPDIQRCVRYWLNQNKNQVQKDFLDTWEMLFEFQPIQKAWEHDYPSYNADYYALKEFVEKDGWNTKLVRFYQNVLQPYIKIDVNYLYQNTPPDNISYTNLCDYISREVVYLYLDYEIYVPDDWLAPVAKALRENLMLAEILEREAKKGLALSYSIAEHIDHNGKCTCHFNLNGAMLRYARIFKRLYEADHGQARKEYQVILSNDGELFLRLRIWMACFPHLVTDHEFAALIRNLSDDLFWNSSSQLDVLAALETRWEKLDFETKNFIEKRLLADMQSSTKKNDDLLVRKKAFKILDTLQQLSLNGCQFSFDLEKIKKQLLLIVPNRQYKLLNSLKNNGSLRSGFVKTNIDCTQLLKVHFSEILETAEQCTGQTNDFLLKTKPFDGLIKGYPIRAFLALKYVKYENDFTRSSWKNFFYKLAVPDSKPRLIGLIAKTLASFTESILIENIYSTCSWLERNGKVLADQYFNTFNEIIFKVIKILELNLHNKQWIISNEEKGIKWLNKAINHPIGMTTEVLFNDPRISFFKEGKGLQNPWLNYVDTLLSLESNARRYVLVILLQRLNWFYYIDPDWTEKNLLILFESDDPVDRSIGWTGLLSTAEVNGKLLVRLKKYLLEKAKTFRFLHYSYTKRLSEMIIDGWSIIDASSKKQYISDDEMRSTLLKADDEFRLCILGNSIYRLEKNGMNWLKVLRKLLRIWPREIAARSSRFTSRLLYLVFKNDKYFLKIYDQVLPLLTKIDSKCLSLDILEEPLKKTIVLYPKKVLELFVAVLSDNVEFWPLGIEHLFENIKNADEKLKENNDLKSLEYKFNFSKRF